MAKIIFKWIHTTNTNLSLKSPLTYMYARSTTPLILRTHHLLALNRPNAMTAPARGNVRAGILFSVLLFFFCIKHKFDAWMQCVRTFQTSNLIPKVKRLAFEPPLRPVWMTPKLPIRNESKHKSIFFDAPPCTASGTDYDGHRGGE